VERARHNADQRLAKVVFEQSVEGLMVTDLQGRILMVNQSFETLTGYVAAQVVGQAAGLHRLGPRRIRRARGARPGAGEAGRWSGEVTGRRRNGERFPLSVSMTTVSDATGAPSHYISILNDVSDQKLQAARIEQLAF
jgi:PAS domain S-box-containing protein